MSVAQPETKDCLNYPEELVNCSKFIDFPVLPFEQPRLNYTAPFDFFYAVLAGVTLPRELNSSVCFFKNDNGDVAGLPKLSLTSILEDAMANADEKKRAEMHRIISSSDCPSLTPLAFADSQSIVDYVMNIFVDRGDAFIVKMQPTSVPCVRVYPKSLVEIPEVGCVQFQNLHCMVHQLFQVKISMTYCQLKLETNDKEIIARALSSIPSHLGMRYLTRGWKWINDGQCMTCVVQRLPSWVTMRNRRLVYT